MIIHTKPKYTEESIQQALYQKHPILTNPVFEMIGFIFYTWESDYLAISKAGYVYECEIKISHSDFLNEAAHKQEKMRLLGGESMTVAKYHSFAQHGIEHGKELSQRPNYFWYVCPEGVISETECPKFAGLMYITNSGAFRCIKVAPCLHKVKYDTQVDLLQLNMRNKFYYAMWNWIRRYWRNVGKAKDIAPQTAAAYERALWKQSEEITELKYRVSSLTQWRDPKEELPENGVDVLVKCSSGSCVVDFYAAELNCFFGEHATYMKVIGWRPICEV